MSQPPVPVGAVLRTHLAPIAVAAAIGLVALLAIGVVLVRPVLDRVDDTLTTIERTLPLIEGIRPEVHRIVREDFAATHAVLERMAGSVERLTADFAEVVTRLVKTARHLENLDRETWPMVPPVGPR